MVELDDLNTFGAWHEVYSGSGLEGEDVADRLDGGGPVVGRQCRPHDELGEAGLEPFLDLRSHTLDLLDLEDPYAESRLAIGARPPNTIPTHRQTNVECPTYPAYAGTSWGTSGRRWAHSGT